MAELAPRDRVRWQAYKCCTFQPYVSCVLAGAMLEEGLDPLSVLEDRAVLLPIGVVATREFRDRRDALADNLRGESELCSYFDRHTRRCRVWKLRPAECSSHFCTEDRMGERDRLSHQAFDMESALAQMALLHLGFSLTEMEEQLEWLNSPKPALVGLSRAHAEEIYRSAWSWLQGVPDQEVQSWLAF